VVSALQNTLLATVVQLDPIYVLFNPDVSKFSEFVRYRQYESYSLNNWLKSMIA